MRRNCWQHYVSTPFICGMIVPFVILDICLEIYHRICFPLFGIPYVKRTKYIKIDRHRLNYLNGAEKLFCAYCGYGNGLLHYASIIVGRTERYWCGIRHKRDKNFIEPFHHKRGFASYGDAEALKKFDKKEKR